MLNQTYVPDIQIGTKPVQQSLGKASANKIPALDGDGSLDPSMMPLGDNYNVNRGIVWSDFSAQIATDYTLTGASSTKTKVTTIHKHGTSSLEVNCNRGSATTTVIAPAHALLPRVDFTGRIGVWVYVVNYALLTSIRVDVSHADTAYTNGAYFVYTFADDDKSFNGWHFICADKAAMTAVGTPDWTADVGAIKLTITQAGATATKVNLDRIVTSWGSKPKFIIMEDTAKASWFTYGLPILDRLGLKSTVGVVASLVGTSTYATEAQLMGAIGRGHEFAVSGAADLTGLADAATASADIATNKLYLTARDLLGSHTCYAWPAGVYEATAGDQTYINLLIAQGFTCARTIATPFQTRIAEGFADVKWTLPTITVAGTDSVATVTGLMDTTVVNDSCAILLYGDLVLTGGSGATRNISDFQQEMQYLANLVATGVADVVTLGNHAYHMLTLDY